MNKNPKISIILPSLNVYKYINECLDSVMNQTLQNLEILCIDAGSTDGTLEILEQYAYNDPRIRVVHSEIKSYGKQINMGFDLAKGKYVAVVETDDLIDSHMYEKLYVAAEENNLDFVKADFKGFRTLGNGYRVYDEGRMWRTDGLYNKVLNIEEFPDLYVRDINIWKGIYNREFLRKYKIRLNETPGAAFQDIGFHHLLLLYAKKGMYIKDMLYLYRRDNESSSTHKQDGIRFGYQEYNRLLKLPLLGGNQRQFYHYLYVRMALVMLGEYVKLLECNHNSNSDIQECVEWFKVILGEKIQQKEILDKDFGEDTWHKINLLINDEKAFGAEWSCEQSSQKEREREFLEKVGSAEVVIFGCGHCGKEYLILCDRNNVRMVAFCDNNPKLWGKEYCGYRICEPFELKSQYSTCKIVIASNKYKDEIKVQLTEMGILMEHMV